MKVAIFDNSLDIIDRLKDLVLESNCVNVIKYATTYDNAVKVITETTPDIVILDLNFQQNRAYELLRKIHKNFRNIKVIVLSIHIETEIKRQSLSLGASYFFDKYHEFEKIPAVINSIAENKN